MTVNQHRLSDLVSAAPSLTSNPGIVVSLLRSPAATPQVAQATATGVDGTTYANYLNSLPDEQKPDYWAQMTDEQRALAYYVGGFTNMEAVTPKQHDESWAEKSLRNTLGAVHWAGSHIASGVGDALRPVSYLGDQVKHGFRAGVVLGQQDGAPEWELPLTGLLGIGSAPIGNALGEDDFVDAWRKTQTVNGRMQITGQDYFDPASYDEARSHYTPLTGDIATRLVKGESRQDIVASASDPDEAANYEQMMRSDVMADAVKEIDGARLSIGRQIARSWLGMDPTSAQWSKVSGLLDAVGGVVLDPTIVAGKANTAWKVGKYAAGGLQEAEITKAFATSAVRHHWDGVAAPLNAVAKAGPNASTDEVRAAGEALGVLNSQYKSVSPALRNQLVDHIRGGGELNKANDFRDFFLQVNNQQELIRGQSAYRERLIPRKNFAERQVTDRVRKAINKPIDWLEGGPRMAARLGVYDGPSAHAQAAIERLTSDYAARSAGTLFEQPGAADELQAKIDQIIEHDHLTSIGEKTAALRGDSVSRVRDRLPAFTANVPLLRGKGARTPEQVEAFKRSERIKFRAAQTFSKLTNQVAVGHEVDGRRVLDLTAPDATDQVYRMARPFMTKQFASDIAATFQASSLSGRRTLVKGLRRSMGEAAGLGRTEQGRLLMKKWDEADDEATRAYSAFDQDKLADGRRAAVMSWQMTDHVSLPDYKEMRAAAAKVGILSHFGDFVTHEFLDRGMSTWRNLVLLNLRRIFREGPEERGRHMLQYGVFDSVKGASVNRAIRRGQKDAQKAVEQSKGTDDPLVYEDIVHDTIMDRLSRSGLAGADAQKYIPQLDAGTRDLFERDIASQAHRADRLNDPVLERQEQMRAGGKLREVSIQKSGDWTDRSTQDDRGAQSWAYVLRRIAGTHDGQIAMRNLDNRQKAVDDLTKLILSPSWKDRRGSSEIFQEAKRVQGSDLGAARDWAGRIFQEVRGHFSDEQGNLLTDLLDDVVPLSDGGAKRGLDLDAITSKRLREIEPERRPKWVIAPELIHVDNSVGMIEKQIRRGYGVLESANNAISRGPIFWAHWVQARKDLQPWEDNVASKVGAEEAQRMAMRNADLMAKERTLDGIDNPEVRSEFAVIARNMIPFWRAQEEFYRRWGRTARYHPEALRKAALTYEGLQHSGFIQTDNQGQDFFLYPGANLAASAISAAGRLAGQDWTLSPEVFNLRGQVRFLNSGFDPSNVQPSLGPLLAAPLKGLQRIMPESRAVEDMQRLALGDQGAGVSLFQGLIPTDLRRLYQATGFFMTTTPQMQAQGEKELAYQEQRKRLLQEQMASGTLTSIKMLEAAGLTPPDDADGPTVEHYWDRVVDHSRGTLLLRAALGMFLPAAPEMQDVAPKIPRLAGDAGQLSVKDEFNVLASKMGYEKAYAIWVERHPDELPLLESQSESPSGALLPATQMAADYITENRDLFHRFPKAAAYLIPQGQEAKFNQGAYTTQQASGLRVKKDWKQFYLDMKLTGHLTTYFDTKSEFDNAISDESAAGRSTADLQDQWRAWSGEYKAMYPLLGQYLAAGSERKADREDTFDQVRRMVSSGTMPPTTGATAITAMVQAYDEYQAAVKSLGSSRSREVQSMKDTLHSRFDAQAAQLAAGDLNASMLYSRLLRYMED